MARKTSKRIQQDYVERGSARHAAVLGLVPDPESPLKWRLDDVTAYGPNATDKFLAEILRQKVSDLTSKMPEPQTEDPFQPGYALPMWKPVGEEDETTGIV